MKIIVCIKQVPSTSKVDIDPVTGVLKRSGIKGKMNPYDLYALEAGLQLKQRCQASLTVVSMGPGQAEETIREAIYMGADDGVLISDRRLGGADVLATSYTLAQAIKALGDFDLIICGKQTTDGDTAQVGAEMAETMKLVHACNVTAITEITPSEITVRLNQEHEIVTQSMPLPCLLCTDGDINSPRLPSYRRKLETGSGSIRTMTLDDLADKDEQHYGLAGSATQVERIFAPDKNEEKTMWQGSVEQLTGRLYDLLVRQKAIRTGE